ncbi:beta-ig-h3 fasciclin [Grosmannia clavigera kw1407]|uniref:Beta-ig-h3 fasciclin n=1 Tax=Grosmannia clavigera (strain kw1407 / UAMH 11150) TaxID=655863 RepID=F0XNK3_GROCL|nr:beta-ig-h3 fasciclin [Grosmannia clavigera kw1407]EFX00256.1 beta-ig-h3 fasciclin [Grosmannia clavigera kw1407]
MRYQPFFSAVLVSGLTSATTTSLPSLYDALVAAGASNFAARIQASPNASELYSSGAIKTVFAPSDQAIGSSSLARRADVSEGTLVYQSCLVETYLQQKTLGAQGGEVLAMGYKSSGLVDTSQKIVADTRPVNTTVSKRQVLGVRGPYRRSANATSLLRIESGLGTVSNVIRGDIAFDGGLIQVTDRYDSIVENKEFKKEYNAEEAHSHCFSYFTLPESLSSTAAQTGQTTFNSLSNKTNITRSLEQTQSITVFLPSNEAFALAGNRTTSTSTLISNHAVSGFVGYLPDLTDGLVLTTKTGDTLTISIRNGIWYINNGAITQANLVLQNGVAHVVDQVLVPTPAKAVTSFGHPSVNLGLSALLCVPLILLSLLF